MAQPNLDLLRIQAEPEQVGRAGVVERVEPGPLDAGRASGGFQPSRVEVRRIEVAAVTVREHERSVLVFAELKAAGGRLQPDQQVWLEALRETAAETYLWTPDDWPTVEEVLS